MNKKFLTVAASLLLALPMTVAAAPSPTTGTIADINKESDVILVGSQSEAENAQKYEKPAIWVEDGNKISDSAAVSAAGDVLNNPEKLCEFEVEANAVAKERKVAVTLTIKLSKAVPDKKVGYVFHWSANGLKLVSKAFTGDTVTVTVNTGDLSPFVVVIGDPKDASQGGNNNQGGNNQGGQGGQTPNTSDSNKSILWGSIAMISLASAAGIVIAKRRNA